MKELINICTQTFIYLNVLIVYLLSDLSVLMTDFRDEASLLLKKKQSLEVFVHLLVTSVTCTSPASPCLAGGNYYHGDGPP